MEKQNDKLSVGTGKLIFTTLTILWMLVIFLYSAKTADESTEQSLAVGMRVGSIIHADFETWSDTAKVEFAQIIDKPIRKMAHMAEYAILGALLMWTVMSWRESTRKSWLIAWLLAVVYACTDEVHQLFVPGRYGSVIDVGIDSVGALIGVLVGSVVWNFIVAKNRKSCCTSQRR